jgi:hypothetical protein
MNDNSDEPKIPDEILPAVTETPKKNREFGSLKPLTAAQIIGLLINSDNSAGACACACGGPCY